MTEQLQQKLVQQIEEAFADTPYPGDNNIGWGCGSEGKEFEVRLRGRHWRELSLEFILENRNEVPCMTPDGFRYYLPAFMVATILHYDEVDTLAGNLIGSLTPSEEDLYQHFLVKVSKFNREEQAAILAFLRSYVQLHPQEYGTWNPVYHPLLDAGIEFWKKRLQDSPES